MKAINLMRLIPHINPVRTSIMRTIFSQVTRHISAMPQQAGCTRGRTVGIRPTYSLDTKIHSRLWDVGISHHHSESKVRTAALNLAQSLVAVRCSWVAWLRMSLSHPQGDFCPGPKEAFSQQTPLYCKTTQDWPKTWRFLVREKGCSRQLRAPEAPSQPLTFLLMALTPTGSTSTCCWSRRAPGRGALVQPLPQNRDPLLGLAWHWIWSRP